MFWEPAIAAGWALLNNSQSGASGIIDVYRELNSALVGELMGGE
jgi:hypothetical protein